MQTIDQHQMGQKKRPELLTILCILTFIGSGLAAFSNLVLFLTYDEMDVLMEEMNVDFEEVMLLLSGGKRFFISGFFLYTISLMGAIAMWRLRKLGFHLYTACLLYTSDAADDLLQVYVSVGGVWC